MRALLDPIYKASHALACACLALIAGLVVAQVLLRLFDALLRLVGQAPMGIIIPSLTELGGFLLVAATALALGPALKAGTHVRVSLLVENVPERMRRGMNALVLLVALLLIGFATYHLWDLTADALAFDERSYGLVAYPLWIPQAVLTAGFAVFAIALVDEFALTLRTGRPGFEAAKEAVAHPAAGAE